jgi:hypothetical protein
MKEHLLRLSQNALESMNRRDFERAVKALSELLEQQPNWEHGGGFYDLASRNWPWNVLSGGSCPAGSLGLL